MLNGPNVRFTDFSQLVSRHSSSDDKLTLTAGLQTPRSSICLQYVKIPDNKSRHDIHSMLYATMSSTNEEKKFTLLPEQPCPELAEFLLSKVSVVIKDKKAWLEAKQSYIKEARVTRSRCFLDLSPFIFDFGIIDDFNFFVQGVIHLPGLRGEPERNYRRGAIPRAVRRRYYPRDFYPSSPLSFSGYFMPYVASLVLDWKQHNDDKIQILNKSLASMSLNSDIVAEELDDASIELKISRLPVSDTRQAKIIKKKNGISKDHVNIADVGLGVSQALPIIVALLAASEGQIVYIEQPELHLHPRAQIGLAKILVDAANRGVRVVAETHSSLLLLAIQTLVANGTISPDIVRLHWFQLDVNGSASIDTAKLDSKGRYGDWPEDFGDMDLRAQDAYLRATGY